MKKTVLYLLAILMICCLVFSACGNQSNNDQTINPTDTSSTEVESEPEFEAEFDDLSDIDIIQPTQEETTSGSEATEASTEPQVTPSETPTSPSTPAETNPTEQENEDNVSPTDEDGRIVLPMIPG